MSAPTVKKFSNETIHKQRIHGSGNRVNNSDQLSNALQSSRKHYEPPFARSRIPKHDTLLHKQESEESESITTEEQKMSSNKNGQKLSGTTGALQQQQRPTSVGKDQEPEPHVRSRSKTRVLKWPSLKGSANYQKRILENAYKGKKWNYLSIKNEIEEKQKVTGTVYKELLQLREKILAAGGKEPDGLDELAPLPLWSASVKGATTGSKLLTDIGEMPVLEFNDDFLVNFETYLRAILDSLLSLGTRILQQCGPKLEPILSLFETQEKDKEEFGDATDLTIDLLKEKLKEEMERSKVEKSELEARLEQTYQEQCCRVSSLLVHLSRLWHQYQVYRERLLADNADLPSQERQELEKELRSEKSKAQKTRAKLREQEMALANTQASLKDAQEKLKQMEKQMQDTLKQLETQLKQKDSSFAQRTKELTKKLKAAEAELAKYKQQKETEETKIAELKAEKNSRENEAKNVIHEQKKRIEKLEMDLKNGENTRQEIETKYREFKAGYVKLEEKCKQLLEITEKSKQLIPGDGKHTEYEIQLFNDLKEAKKVLSDREEIIKKLQAERDEIISVAEKSSNKESKDWKQLAADLLKKSSELESTQKQLSQLQIEYKKLEEKWNLNAAGKSVGSAAHLTQQMLDLRNSYAESEKRRKDLEQECEQQQIQLYRYERALLQQQRRIDLQDVLKLAHAAADRQPNTSLALPDQIANDADVSTKDYIQQLQSELEQKDLQMKKLEKLVKEMEKQEEQMQKQRTRLEARIAELQVNLNESKRVDRNRGFSFL